MSGRRRVDLEAFFRIDVFCRFQQSRTDRHCLVVSTLDVVDVKVEMNLLGCAVGPFRRNVIWCELNVEPVFPVDADGVPVVFRVVDCATPEFRPKRAFGGKVCGIEDGNTARDPHVVIIPRKASTDPLSDSSWKKLLVVLNHWERVVEVVKELTPLLVGVGMAEPLGVIFETIPLDQQQVSGRGLDALLKTDGPAPRRRSDDRESRSEGPFEVLLLSRNDVNYSVFEDHRSKLVHVKDAQPPSSRVGSLQKRGVDGASRLWPRESRWREVLCHLRG
jgi:hypothetical protein